MPFGFLIATVNFNCITHCLKSVKGQSDWKNNIKMRDWIMMDCPGKYFCKIGVQKIIVFKKNKHANIRNKT